MDSQIQPTRYHAVPEEMSSVRARWVSGELSPGTSGEWRERWRERTWGIHIPYIYSLLDGELRSYLEFPNQLIADVTIHIPFLKWGAVWRNEESFSTI